MIRSPIGPDLDASVVSDEGGRGERGSFTGALAGDGRVRHLGPRLSGGLRRVLVHAALIAWRTAFAPRHCRGGVAAL